jgi:thiamine biosynthesis protein ThiS
MKTLTINGEERQSDALTIGDLLKSINVHPRTVVVEHNGQIIPRSNYESLPLNEGDRLEIVQMMAGG